MPLYEYRCTSCGYSFEKIQNFSAKPEVECPKCQGVLIRPVTAPALRFEGAGWYVNDYAGKGGAKTSESAKGGDAESAPAAKDTKNSAAEAGSATPTTPSANSTPAATGSSTPGTPASS